MAGGHYPQFCALARAAEVLGERWTLLIVRELWLGPKRFSDLRARLDGISTSVLADRLTHLAELGAVQRTYLEPPAASTVYELTELGQTLEPAMFELVRWGARLLMPRRPDDRFEPDWLRLALAACAARRPTPEVSFELRVPTGGRELRLWVVGGATGTSVSTQPAVVGAVLQADGETLLALATGLLDPAEARRQSRLSAEGDPAVLALFPRLFDVTLPVEPADAQG